MVLNLLWSLPVLQQWSSPLEAAICSVWSSAWLCLDGWWCWSFGHSGTAADCLLGKCDDQGLGPRDWLFSCLPDLVAVCCESSDDFSICLDQFCWYIVNSSWHPFPQWLYSSFHFFANKWGGHLLCLSGTVQYWWISIGLVIVQLGAVFCSSVQYLLFFCKACSWIVWDSSSFPLFPSGQVFHLLVCSLAVVSPQIFLTLTTMFSYPVFFCLFSGTAWCCCSLPCTSQILHVWIFSSSVLSFCCTDQEFLQWLSFFFFWWCLPRISRAVSVTAVIMDDGEMCKLPAYHSLESFQHTVIFQLFEVKLESVCSGLLILFQMKQVMVTSNVCSWDTLCSGNVLFWLDAVPH